MLRNVIDHAVNDLFKVTRKHHCFIPCEPPRNTSQSGNRIHRKKDGTYFVGKNKKQLKTQATLKRFLSLHKPTRKFTGMLKLNVHWVYPFKRSETKKNKSLGYIPCNKRPDLDNIAKGLLDAMQKADWIEDDGQIYNLQLTKLYGELSGIWLEIYETELTRVELS